MKRSPTLLLLLCSALALAGPSRAQVSSSAFRVLGQPDLSQNTFNTVEGVELRSPSGLALDTRGGAARLYVADFSNHRILGWADARTFANGAKADLVLGQPNLRQASPLGIGNRGFNGPTTVAVDPLSGEFISGPTVLTENGEPVTVWSIHVSDVAFRFDGAMFVSANEPGPPPPEPLSRYLEVDPATASVVSAVDGPDDLYAAGIVFIGQADQIVAMDIRGEDDIFILDLANPPTLDATLLYPDPIPTNSGTADLAGCAKLEPQ